jgi:hypothetical protein
MIWTERFLEPGEFELRSPDINTMLTMLPVDAPSLISLLDSKEVMIVESHSIEVDDSGVKTLVTKGRSLDSFLEQRVTHGLSGVAFKMPKQYNNPGAAEILLWNALVNATTYDVCNNTPDRDQYDAIPGVAISETLYDPGAFPTLYYWWLEPGYVNVKLLEFLDRGHLGIRCIRPPSPSAYIVTFSNTGGEAGSGIISRTQTYDVPELLFDVYNGTDRSASVKFSQTLGDFDNPQFLFFIKELKRCGWATSTLVQTNFYYNGDNTTWQGLKKRWEFFDGGSDYGTDPLKINDTLDMLKQKIEALLKSHQSTLFFNGPVSSEAKYEYGTDYFLGDTVKLVADYGVSQSVKVLEYIRGEDENGEIGIPTLSYQEPDTL